MVLIRKNMIPIDYVHCCVIGCHGNSLLHFGLNTKVSCERLSGGGVNCFEMIVQSSTVKFHI